MWNPVNPNIGRNRIAITTIMDILEEKLAN